MDKLEKELAQLNEVHSQTDKLLDSTTNIPASLIKEYNRGMEQYSGMYKSIEQFKKMASEASIDNFVNQQVEIVRNWIEYELNIQQKLREIK